MLVLKVLVLELHAVDGFPAGAIASGALEPDAAFEQRVALGAAGSLERRLLKIVPGRRLRERLRRVFRSGLLGSGGKGESGERTGCEKGQFHRRSFTIIHLADNSLANCMVCIKLSSCDRKMILYLQPLGCGGAEVGRDMARQFLASAA